MAASRRPGHGGCGHGHVVADVLADWRREERRQAALPAGSPEHRRSAAAAERFRRLYQRLVAELLEEGIRPDDPS